MLDVILGASELQMALPFNDVKYDYNKRFRLNMNVLL